MFEIKSKVINDRYPGLIIHETNMLKHGSDIVLPSRIFVASDYRLFYGEAILQHGYGHYLQYKKHGFLFYYFVIGPSSIWFAMNKNHYGWTEIEANQLAHKFFGKNSMMGNKHFPLSNR